MSDVHVPTSTGSGPSVDQMPSRLLLGLAEGYCNLKCPMCWVFGQSDKGTINGLRGRTTLEQARQILDDVTGSETLVHTSLWNEPLLTRDFETHLRQIKERGLKSNTNTNGLLLDEKTATMLVELEIDSVMISIDATTPETYSIVRASDEFDVVVQNVHRFLHIRGEREYPRIGVTFTVQEANAHERQAFIDQWTQIVDVVRVGEMIAQGGKHAEVVSPENRVPCRSLYHTMAVASDGTARICCLDTFGTTDMGNVLTEGVQKVWLGDPFTRARRAHEEGDWDAVPFCKGCDEWMHYEYEESTEDVEDGELLIRRSPTISYYNRIDRLRNWSGTLQKSFQDS